MSIGACTRPTTRGLATGSELLIRRQCRAFKRPGYLAAGLPGWLALACIVLPCFATLYGQNQATRMGQGSSCMLTA